MPESLANFDPSLSSQLTSSAQQADIDPSGRISDKLTSDINGRPFYDNILPKNVQDINSSPETMYETANKPKEENDKLVVLPERKPIIQERFIPLQKWEGTVLRVTSDYFEARLVDQTNKENQDEVAEFMLDEVSDADLDLVKPGSIFYWNIGYEISPAGQRKRASIIRFRRLPKWSAHEIEAAKNDAKRTRDILNWK